MRKGFTFIELAIAIFILALAMLPLFQLWQEGKNPRPRPAVPSYNLQRYEGERHRQTTAPVQQWKRVTYITFIDADGNRVEMAEGTYVITPVPQ